MWKMFHIGEKISSRLVNRLKSPDSKQVDVDNFPESLPTHTLLTFTGVRSQIGVEK
jgi:hypothetical protein